MAREGLHVCKGGIADIERAAPEQAGREELRERFILLRAKGYSLDKCAKQLKLSKGTLSNWNRELEEDIARFKAIELEALQEEYYLVKEARIRFLGEQLRAIREEIEGRGFEGVSTGKLLELQLSYYRELLAEYVEPVLLSEGQVAELKGLKH